MLVPHLVVVVYEEQVPALVPEPEMQYWHSPWQPYWQPFCREYKGEGKRRGVFSLREALLMGSLQQVSRLPPPAMKECTAAARKTGMSPCLNRLGSRAMVGGVPGTRPLRCTSRCSCTLCRRLQTGTHCPHTFCTGRSLQSTSAFNGDSLSSHSFGGGAQDGQQGRPANAPACLR